MSEPVRVYIERVKAAFGVETDEALAGKIGYAKQAVANWRKRGGIPVKASVIIAQRLGAAFSYDPHIAEMIATRETRMVNALMMFPYRVVLAEFDPDNVDERTTLEVGNYLETMRQDVLEIIRDERFYKFNDIELFGCAVDIMKAKILPDLVHDVSILKGR